MAVSSGWVEGSMQYGVHSYRDELFQRSVHEGHCQCPDGLQLVPLGSSVHEGHRQCPRALHQFVSAAPLREPRRSHHCPAVVLGCCLLMLSLLCCCCLCPLAATALVVHA